VLGTLTISVRVQRFTDRAGRRRGQPAPAEPDV